MLTSLQKNIINNIKSGENTDDHKRVFSLLFWAVLHMKANEMTR